MMGVVGMAQSREHFSSRIGFVLAAAGSAVGIGNLVGFPLSAAKNGGGAFLLIYALFVFFICVPIMMAEMSMGKKTQLDPLGAYHRLTNRHSGWAIAGWLSIITPFMITVFYLVVTVWILGYLSMTLMGRLEELASPDTFSTFINSGSIFVYMAVVLAIMYGILFGGVKKGIENAAKKLMPALFILLIGLVLFVLTRDNAMAGVGYYLVPDFSKLDANTINGALSQAFFSLSLGMGIMITYGSYIESDTNIPQSAQLVAITDTAVAFTAGLMILPAIFSFNPSVQPDELSTSSVAMIFTYLPQIFLELQGSIGYVAASVVASVFFLLVFFAAITSLVSIFEVPVSALMSHNNRSRPQALLLCGGVLVLLSICCAVSFGLVPWLSDLMSYGGQQRSFFDVVYDIFYETILPLNGLLLCLFVMFRWRRQGLNDALVEGSSGYDGSVLQRYVNLSLHSFIPLILAVVFINTVLTKYFAISLFG